MKHKLKDFPITSAPVVKDELGKLRIAKTAVSTGNDLVIRYYLPLTKADRRLIATCANAITSIQVFN